MQRRCPVTPPPAGGPAETAQPRGVASDPDTNMVAKRLVQLEQLAALRDSGVLTDAEFEAEKIKVLGGD